MHSIVGRKAKVGAWCHIEGSAACSDPNPNVANAKMTPQLPLFNALDGRLNPSITILGRYFFDYFIYIYNNIYYYITLLCIFYFYYFYRLWSQC
jgi:hypothetical protein